MVGFDFFEKLDLLYFFRQLSGTKLPAHKKHCATLIKKSIQNGERERW